MNERNESVSRDFKSSVHLDSSSLGSYVSIGARDPGYIRIAWDIVRAEVIRSSLALLLFL